MYLQCYYYLLAQDHHDCNSRSFHPSQCPLLLCYPGACIYNVIITSSNNSWYSCSDLENETCIINYNQSVIIILIILLGL